MMLGAADDFIHSGRVGPVTTESFSKYEAGAMVYLDHALYTPVSFVEATFDWGESVLPASRAMLPDAHLDTALSVSDSAGIAVSISDPDNITLEV
jgi:hypothetical protein